jgi:hypothetical protein
MRANTVLVCVCVCVRVCVGVVQGKGAELGLCSWQRDIAYSVESDPGIPECR